MRQSRLDYLLIGGLLLLVLMWLLPFYARQSIGQEYNETSLVNTTVNITNTAPQVFGLAFPPQVNLYAYGNTTVQCNVSSFDYNNNTLVVNASFHQANLSPLGVADQNFRYYNTNCTRVSDQDYTMNWTCNFSVNYFANNGTWLCNATAWDTRNASGSNQSQPGAINPLVAIKMNAILDFGQLEANQISNDTNATITNAGNRPANITVEGYAQTPGDNLAMICDIGQIDVGYEHYSITPGLIFSFMMPLSSSTAQIQAFHVPQRVSETIESTNTTYWKIQIPPVAGGICRGKIKFTAVDRGT